MSQLDDELAQAVAESEAVQASELEKPRAAATRNERSPKGNVGLLIGLLVAVGGVLTLFLTSGKDDGLVYSKGVDQLLSEQNELDGRYLKVEGDLIKGSLTFREKPCEYRFRMQKNGKQVDVRYPRCVVPDTFRDMPGMDVKVTVQGKLASAGHFEADQIMAKCPSKYEMKDRASRGEKAPHNPAAIGGAMLPTLARP